MVNITIKVSQDVRDVVENLFWVLEKRPEGIAMSSSEERFIIDNLESNKRLTLEVE